MSGVKGQKQADHQHAADQARQMPGRWVLAATYNGRASAVSAAHQVRTAGRLPAYAPAGSFEARVELTQDGADLWVRYLPTTGFRKSVDSGLTESFDDFSTRLAAADTTRRTS